jgi:predicted nucleotide-binding protein
MLLCNNCKQSSIAGPANLLFCSVKKAVVCGREECKEYASRALNPIDVFIGSSGSERSKNIADCIHICLEEKEIRAQVWRDNVFQPSKASLPELERCLDDCNAGVFVFEPEDLLKICTGNAWSGEQEAVRDNVLLEFGMFFGRHGGNRTFIVFPKSKLAAARQPSDLKGITYVLYNDALIRNDTEIQQHISPVIKQQIAMKLLKEFKHIL